jgi:DNA-binding NtrC family response regulator
MSPNTVLLVDNDESITKSFSRILEKHGYSTDIARTGKEAIQKASIKFYNIALIDIFLPDINGTDLLEQLPDREKMIKIIITGFPKSAMKNADAYLEKPVRPQDLLALMKEKIEQKTRI